MKYAILLLSLMLLGCNNSVDKSEPEELRKDLDALSIETQQFDKDYERQTADYDRQTKVIDEQLKQT